MLSILFAFGAALLSAITVVTQHVASTETAADKGWRLALYLFRNPLWLFGVGATVGSFVFQAVALSNGRLSVVQSILVTELVFSLVIGRVWLRLTVGPGAWVSAAVTSCGLAVFLGMSEPKGGHPEATTEAWLPALVAFGGAALACTVLASRGSALRRGALYAAASGIVSATLATFLKSSTNALADSGVLATLTRGPIYGVLVSGIVSTVLTQAALHYGPLALSQPLMVITNPLSSVALGIWLYGEHFTGGPVEIGVAAAGFTAMVVGLVFLARTAPSFESTS